MIASRYLPALRLFLFLAGVALIGYAIAVSSFTETFLLEPIPIILALLVSQAAWFLHALRFRAVLGIFGIPLRVLNAYRVHVESIFFVFFLPFGVGMDIAKFFKIDAAFARGVTRSRLVGILLADRLLGFGIAFFVGVLAFLTYRGGIDLALDWVLLGTILVVGITALAYLVYRRRHFLLYAADVLRVLLDNIGEVALAAGFNALAIGILGLALWLAGSMAGFGIGLSLTLFTVCTAMVAQVLPVSFAGVGGGEMSMVAIIIAAGHPETVALSVATIYYMFRLTAAVIGGCLEGRAILRHLRQGT